MVFAFSMKLGSAGFDAQRDVRTEWKTEVELQAAQDCLPTTTHREVAGPQPHACRSSTRGDCFS